MICHVASVASNGAIAADATKGIVVAIIVHIHIVVIAGVGSQ
jgi:hypothetical protein